MRTMTLEQLKARPQLSETELAENGAAMAALLSESRRIREAYLARGGRVMSDAEWQAEWDSRYDHKIVSDESSGTLY